MGAYVFPRNTNNTVWIITCEGTSSSELYTTITLLRHQPWAIILDKRKLGDKAPADLPEGHGESGPIVRVLAQILHEILQDSHRIN